MTIENILMPQLGESVTEGTIEKWLVKPGDLVNKYDPIAEVVTDKVNAEIPSSFTGIIHELIANEGETLSVGTVVCTMLVEGEKPSEKKDSIEKAPAKKINKNEFSPTQHNSNKARFSPAVLKLANEYQI
ncbi:2-oxo acid dehydrogenase subunit E2, partial [Butyricicoccus sp. 1XD8-22]